MPVLPKESLLRLLESRSISARNRNNSPAGNECYLSFKYFPNHEASIGSQMYDPNMIPKLLQSWYTNLTKRDSEILQGQFLSLTSLVLKRKSEVYHRYIRVLLHVIHVTNWKEIQTIITKSWMSSIL
jgi:hypothetical protein